MSLSINFFDKHSKDAPKTGGQSQSGGSSGPDSAASSAGASANNSFQFGQRNQLPIQDGTGPDGRTQYLA